MSDPPGDQPPGNPTKAVAAKPPEAPLPVEPKVDITVDLPEAEILKRLRLVNPELVKEVYDLAKAQVQAEGARHTMLNAKAMSVVTGAGVSLTLSLSIAGPLLTGGVILSPWLLFGFGVTGVTGVAAVLLGVWALLVKGGFAQVSDHAVFDEKALEFADNPTGCDDLPDLKERYAFGAAAYRQHMTAHLWAVAVKDHRQLDKKANQVQAAQYLFAAFVILVLACEARLFQGIYVQNNAREAAAARTAATEGAVRRQRAVSTAAAQVAAANASQAAKASSHAAPGPTVNSGSWSRTPSGGTNAAGGATF
jgi:hypothetical protein